MVSIGVQIEVALLLQYQALPQEGHIEVLYLIFQFLSKNPNNILVMEPSVLNVEKCVFNLNAYLKEFYGDVVEEDPHQILQPLGKPVYLG